MPRIDDLKVQNKVFKKKDYRSWDGNLLDKLRLPKENINESEPPQEINDKKHRQAAESNPRTPGVNAGIG